MLRTISKYDLISSIRRLIKGNNRNLRLVVDHERTVRVLQSGVGGQDRVVRFNYGSGHLGCRVNTELELALLSVIRAQPLQQQRSESRSCTSSERVEDEESLKTGTVVGESSNSVHDVVDQLLSDGVVSTSVVVGGILLSVDQGLGVEERPVLSGPDLVDNIGLQIDLEITERSSSATEFQIDYRCCRRLT
jgi:hypothetical protein